MRKVGLETPTYCWRVSEMMPFFSRRDTLKAASCGFGYLAFAGLSTLEAVRAAGPMPVNPLAPKTPHHAPKAKRVIFLCMRGAPSHLDTFDYKPALAKDEGKKGAGTGRLQGRLLPSPWNFQPSGKSGLRISELFPELARHADKLCLLNGMHTDVPNHPQSFLMLHTGEFRFTRPSMGSWILYGLGTENQDLPGFVTISPPADLGGAQNYSNAFLAAAYQATRIGQQGTPVADAKVGNLGSLLSTEDQRKQLDLLQAMNEDLLERKQVNPEIEGVIGSYELAFRMQRALPRLMDLSGESRKTMEMYGIGNGRPGRGAGRKGGVRGTEDFGRQCLMARRFVEAGVRFVEVSHGNWDTHNGLKARMPQLCGEIDQPIAALLTDLEQRGLLADTLVVWGGEFGRTPTGQGDNGRNHNSAGFSMWLAGGGVKGGQRVGATDEHGARAVENKMHHHDLHATVLHLLGLNHQKLTYRYGGRDYSLTDIHGRVVSEILA
jgi:hypothetical protein